MKRLLYIIGLFVMVSCQHQSLQLQKALELSGNNREEIEKVLSYFKKQDKISYKAACFLIENMQYHQSKEKIKIEGDYENYFHTTDSLYQSIFKGMSTNQIQVCEPKDKDSIRINHAKAFNKLPSSERKTIYKSDLELISADYLIDNIESAIMIWKTSPLIKQLNFNDFKEFVLPYCTTNEARLLKRSMIKQTYNHLVPDKTFYLLEELLENYKVYVDKCRWINKYIKPSEHIGIYDLFIPKFKMDCHNMTNWSCNILRSCGVPVVYEYTPKWRERDSKHFWCVSPNQNGILQPYTAPDNNLREDWESDIQYAGKVYRKTFGAQSDTPYFLAKEEEYIPEEFNTPLLLDQTFRYHQTVTLRIPLENYTTTNNLAYLCMFSCEDLIPVGWGKINHHKKEIIFEQVPLNTLFFPIIFDEQQMIEIISPFILHSEKTQKKYSYTSYYK